MSSSLREKFQDALQRTVSTMPDTGVGAPSTPRLQTRSPLLRKAPTPAVAIPAHTAPPSKPGAVFFQRYKYPIIVVSIVVVAAFGYVAWKKYGSVWSKKKGNYHKEEPRIQQRQRLAGPPLKRRGGISTRQPPKGEGYDDEYEDHRENQYTENAPPMKVRWANASSGNAEQRPRAPPGTPASAPASAPARHVLPPEEASDPNFTPL